MRILLTCHRFFPHVGGTEEVVLQLATRFASAGHEVTVATSREPGTPLAENRQGLHVRRFALRTLGRYRFPPRAYARFVMGGTWDLVHLHGQRVWSTDYLYRHLGARGFPVVFTPHGFHQLHVGGNRLDGLYYRRFLPWAMRRVDRVIAITEGEARELQGLGVPADKVTEIPDGIDLVEFGEFPGGFREGHGIPGSKALLLYVGGFYANKRLDLLAEAVALVPRPVHLVLIGKDADPRFGRGRFEALAARLGLRAQVLGLVPRREVLAAYGAADLFLLGSSFEGFGLVLLEAMSAGLPFVSTPVGAAPELAATGAGRIVGDAVEMGEAVRLLLDDPEARVAMGKRGREAVRRYTWERIAEEHLGLYEAEARSWGSHP